MQFLMAFFLTLAWAEPGPKSITIRETSLNDVISNDTDDQETKPEPLTDNEVQAMSAVVSAVIRTVLTPTEQASTVRGRCTYRGGFCPGALVELKDRKGQVLASQSLASVDGFVFLNIKPGRYNLEVSYPRYHLKAVQRPVSPGSEILVEMAE